MDPYKKILRCADFLPFRRADSLTKNIICLFEVPGDACRKTREIQNCSALYPKNCTRSSQLFRYRISSIRIPGSIGRMLVDYSKVLFLAVVLFAIRMSGAETKSLYSASYPVQSSSSHDSGVRVSSKMEGWGLFFGLVCCELLGSEITCACIPMNSKIPEAFCTLITRSRICSVRGC